MKLIKLCLQIPQSKKDEDEIVQSTICYGKKREDLYEIPEELREEGQHILEIYLKCNFIKKLPSWLGQLKNLTNLYLYGNRLQSLPNEIEELESLFCLDVGLNNLVTLPSTIGKLSQLNFLCASRNYLTCLPDEICKLTSLKVLLLSGNMISHLPESVCNCIDLEELCLDENCLTSLPQRIVYLPKLDFLSVMGNQLLYLPALPFISSPKLCFERNPFLNYLTFCLGSQFSFLAGHDGGMWKLDTFGCFESNVGTELLSNFILHIKTSFYPARNYVTLVMPQDLLMVSNTLPGSKKVPSMYELSIRVVYQILNNHKLNIEYSNGHHVITMINEQKNCIPQNYPQNISNQLRKGPTTICNNPDCNTPIFTHAFVWIISKQIVNTAGDIQEILSAIFFCSDHCSSKCTAYDEFKLSKITTALSKKSLCSNDGEFASRFSWELDSSDLSAFMELSWTPSFTEAEEFSFVNAFITNIEKICMAGLQYRRWGMESNLVAEFVAQTGADSTVAQTFLQAKGWNLKLALQAYLYMPDDTSNHWSVHEENGNLTEPRHTLSSRPVLQKSDAIDCAKKLTRGISRATENINLVSRARSDIAHDFRENTVYNVNHYFIETPVFTFTLPDLTIYPEDFRGFLEKDLIEMSSLVSLEQAGRLNWWADSGACQRLWPLATTGDGNCLLHAASLGMWGFHDRLLTLRKALYGFLSSSECKDSLWRRWRWQQTIINAQAGFVYSEEEWKREWSNIVEMASTEPRKLESGRRRSILIDRNLDELSENATYESLEEIHVLALAHVLRRPIVVIADLMLKDVNGEDLAPIPFGGVYLPLECAASDCHRSPLVLTYDAAHFSALVVMEKETFVDRMPQPPAVIPITNSDHELLPIQFSIDPGKNFNWNSDEMTSSLCKKFSLSLAEQMGLLGKYLDIIQVPIPSSPGVDEGDIELEGGTNNFTNDEEDIEKRFCEVLETNVNEDNTQMGDSGLFTGNRSKAAKQLQSVAKQFGSIGKSMSKKLKKNLGSITKITRTNSQKKGVSTSPVRQTTRLNSNLVSRSQDYILCARIHTEKRHEFQEEMVRNYLQSARIRFQRDKVLKQKQAEERRQKDEMKLKELARLEGPSNCINPGCDQYGTAITSYMCKDCYEKQRDREMSTNINSPVPSRVKVGASGDSDSSVSEEVYAPRYGAGKSRFYTEADALSHSVVSRLPSSKAGSNIDQTLYLSRSTFYNDTSSTVNSSDNKLNVKADKENLRTSGQEYSVPSYSPSPTGNWPEEIGGLLGTKSGTSETPLARIHSYNLARTWEGNRTSDGHKVDSSHSAGHTSNSTLMPESSCPPLRSSTSLGTRNVSVATLSPQSSNELPNVERVTAGHRTAVGVWVPCSGAYPCRTNNCKFFGNPESDYYCSKCYKEVVQPSLKSLQVQEVKR
ncbi:Ubiquitin thioesterase trabid [Gryllus bimaculatus]|nr:Ubiquitin thioesterase trabid [Gryllus bimaculatus]